ncbi:MAG: endonuclease III [Rhodospirillaceae bacterium]|jgi:endonuclease III|nr:endonuclease III [Rhodospirillaceae bacterium]MBT5243027.1 endonuclease III [Rhodospirillaceae bacterium]MBT5563252.1 endonuclease III [Rhodospirillaceae bacterium]MBT6243566.1 endonuclease III [Rhodospirillaceae bacterium]
MKKTDIEIFYQTLSDDNPDPRGELDWVNTYTLLVAVVLSAQATDVGVNKATGPLFKKVKTPAAMLKLGEEGLRGYIKSIGLFNTKARNVIKLSQMLVDGYAGKVPEDRGELEKLPGVGRKTASVVMNIAFGAPTIAVDTHIYRISNRTGLAPGKNVLAVEAKLEKVTPAHWKLHAHHWLILLGRYVCKARKPECYRCLVRDVCAFKGKTTL